MTYEQWCTEEVAVKLTPKALHYLRGLLRRDAERMVDLRAQLNRADHGSGGGSFLAAIRVADELHDDIVKLESYLHHQQCQGPPGG